MSMSSFSQLQGSDRCVQLTGIQVLMMLCTDFSTLVRPRQVPWFAGILLGTFLTGVVVTMLFEYYNYYCDDRLRLKLFVAVLVSLLSFRGLAEADR